MVITFILELAVIMYIFKFFFSKESACFNSISQGGDSSQHENERLESMMDSFQNTGLSEEFQTQYEQAPVTEE